MDNQKRGWKEDPESPFDTTSRVILQAAERQSQQTREQAMAQMEQLFDSTRQSMEEYFGSSPEETVAREYKLTNFKWLDPLLYGMVIAFIIIFVIFVL
jgi:hypothetical protein